MISRSTIDQIYQAALIEDVIGEFVTLKKSGKSYKGLSPFSSERTPSFYVVPTKGIYKDFSSGKGGNVVDFLMQHQKLTYPEALRWLAQKYNIPIEETEDSEQEKEEKSEREQLSRVVEYANSWFQEQLHQTDAGQNIGLSYFEQRGFRTETLTKWQLGFAPAGWDHLKKAAIAAGYNPQYLVKAGLLKEKETENTDPEKENQSEQNRTYDAFRDRVMFPIHSESGKVIAFAGRTPQADLKGAKYINSPESELFHKSDILYGLHLAKNTIVKENVCYLVEGYTDVISMHQAGVTNIVASCGTSLTDGHIKKIIRYTKNITVLFDGDAAGIKASLRSIEMILKQGMNVRVVLFPDGDDPDSFARKHDSDFIQDFLSKNATDFVRFKTNLLLEEAGKDPLKRAELIKDIILSISIIPDVIQREVYIQECSQLLNVSQESLMLQLNQTLRKQKIPASDLAQIQSIEPENLQDSNNTIPIPEFYTYFQERDIVRLLLTYGDYEIPIFVVNENNEEIQTGVSLAEFIMTNIEQDQLQFEEPRYREIYRQYTQFIEELTYPELRHFTFHDNQEISQSVTDLIATKYEISKNWAIHHIYIETEEKNLRKAALDAVNRLKLAKIKKLQDEIILQIQEKAEQPELIDQLLTDKIKLEMAKAKLADYFGSVIL